METLFTEIGRQRRDEAAPLAVRMRPESLDEVVGQAAAVGPGSWLRAAIEHDELSSLILFGPAGTGKTSIAHVIANTTKAAFVEVSAVGGTVADLRREIQAADDRLSLSGMRTILFVDEIHRFNRSQQDALLHAVEDRIVVLVGATTENPFFEVNSALISRSRIVELQSLDDSEISLLLDHALADGRGLGGRFTLDDDAREAIVLVAGGDGRAALTTLELASQLAAGEDADAVAGGADAAGADGAYGGRGGRGRGRGGGKQAGKLWHVAQDAREAAAAAPASFGRWNPDGTVAIALAAVKSAVPHRTFAYDKNKDVHYDVISAFIKSMRGSDPDAALYWLARMVEGGEDPKFIARRMFILASEDIGNADPQALLVAEAAFRAAEVIGYPECRINLAQAAIYLALAPKSNAVVMGIDTAQHEVRTGPARAVPDHLRDRHRPGSQDYGPYLYPHNFPGAWVEQQYLPDGLERGCFYRPSERGWEAYRTELAARRNGDAE